jgi:hypothetical protein
MPSSSPIMQTLLNFCNTWSQENGMTPLLHRNVLSWPILIHQIPVIVENIKILGNHQDEMLRLD